MLRHKGALPHSDYTALQNELNSRGFPTQCRNVAVVNGSNSGTQQAPVGSFNPNDIILQYDAIFVGGLSAFIKVRTNALSTTNATVSSLVILSGVVPLLIKEKSFTFNALNYDIAAGGYLNDLDPQSIGVGFFEAFNIMNLFGPSATNHGRDRFCFVPLFSSVASTAPRSVQSDLARSVSQIKANGWTPFNEIYSDSKNDKHAEASDEGDEIPLGTMLYLELGIDPYSTPSSCAVSGMPAAPTPTFSTSSFNMCPNEYRVFKVNTTSNISNFYNYSWVLSGSGVYQAFNGEQTTVSGIPPGFYTLTCTRSYGGGLNGASSSYSQTVSVYSSSHPSCCPTQPCHEARIAPDLSTADSEPESNSIASLSSWPNPASEMLSIRYTAEKSGEIEIKLRPVSLYSPDILLTKSYREAGDYEDTFYLNNASPGLYLLIYSAEHNIQTQKILVSNPD